MEVALFAVLAYYTWEFAATGRERGTEFVAGGDLYLLWPLFYLVPLSFALVLVETLFVLLRNVLGDRVSIAMHDGPEVEAL